MKILEKPIEWYVAKLKDSEYFSIAGYSDAEWLSILDSRPGATTGLGQILDAGHGKLLLDVLKRRQGCEDFLFAVPECLWELPAFENLEIDICLAANGISIEACERDIVTDYLAKAAGLYPLIHQLQKMDVVVIGNKHLRGLDFLMYRHFVEISSPNLHMESCGIGVAVHHALKYGKPAVYLVSAGVSAAIIIDQLHDKIPNSFFIDCGSNWDTFVGCGGQREWRQKLYDNPEQWKRWKDANLIGSVFEWSDDAG